MMTRPRTYILIVICKRMACMGAMYGLSSGSDSASQIAENSSSRKAPPRTRRSPAGAAARRRSRTSSLALRHKHSQSLRLSMFCAVGSLCRPLQRVGLPQQQLIAHRTHATFRMM